MSASYIPWRPYQVDDHQSTALSISNRLPYDYAIKLTDALDVTYGVGIITGWDQTNQRHTVAKPTEDGADSTKCVIMPGCKGADNELMVGTIYPTKPVIVRYDTADGTPDIGDSLGTKSGSWKLKVGNAGFLCLGVVDATEGLCLVRPFAKGQVWRSSNAPFTISSTGVSVTSDGVTVAGTNPIDISNLGMTAGKYYMPNCGLYINVSTSVSVTMSIYFPEIVLMKDDFTVTGTGQGTRGWSSLLPYTTGTTFNAWCPGPIIRPSNTSDNDQVSLYNMSITLHSSAPCTANIYAYSNVFPASTSTDIVGFLEVPEPFISYVP